MLMMPSRTRVITSRQGVAAMEFAILAPVMFLLVIGVFDVAKGLIIWEQLYDAARNITISASSISVQPDKTTTLSPAQAQQAMSTIYAEMPWLRDGIEKSVVKSIVLSSVTFVPVANCQQSTLTNCYIPYVAWSASYGGGAGQVRNPFQAVRRACGKTAQINPADPLSSADLLTKLRTLNISEPDPILVADVQYQYKPFFAKFITGPMNLSATGYWSVRSVDQTQSPVYQFTSYAPADPKVNCPNPPATF